MSGQTFQAKASSPEARARHERLLGLAVSLLNQLAPGHVSRVRTAAIVLWVETGGTSAACKDPGAFHAALLATARRFIVDPDELANCLVDLAGKLWPSD